MSKDFKQGDWVWDIDGEEVAEVVYDQTGFYVGVEYEDGEMLFVHAFSLVPLAHYSATQPVDRRRP